MAKKKGKKWKRNNEGEEKKDNGYRIKQREASRAGGEGKRERERERGRERASKNESD